MEDWGIGGGIRILREEQEISLEQLCRGLCSAATLSRIEAGERTAGMMLAQRLLERLGYQPNGYEIYCGREEFDQYEKRQRLIMLGKKGQYTQLEEELKRYEADIDGEMEPLQRQFLKRLYGEIGLARGDAGQSRRLFEEAVSLTVPGWREKEWSILALGEEEMELFSLLADAYAKTGEREKAYQLWNGIWRYLKAKKVKEENMGEFHIGLLCRMAAYCADTGDSQAAAELCDEGLEILALTTRIYHWDWLLYLKGKGMEGLYQAGKADRQEVIEVYKRAYAAARLFKKEEEAANIQKHLREEYGWEFTR